MEGWIMALKYSSISSSGGTGFNVQIGSKYSYATFTQALPAGAYTIKSSNNYTNWDVYLLDASNNLVAYTGTASIAPVSAFSAIVVVNGTVNDILQFSYQTTVFSTAETTQTNAGPFITAATPTSLPNQNNTITVTGGNFASGTTATFTGSDLVQRTAKAVIYNSATSLTITRPDSMPVAYAPYTLTLGNPGINNPTTSNAHTFGNITVGAMPVWQTSASQTAPTGIPYSLTISATDADGGSTVSYSYVSGTVPAGLSFNSSTGVFSGTPTDSVNNTSYTYTIRATDSGGNTADRTFTFTISVPVITGGTLTSDTQYYYRAFTGNGTLAVSNAQIPMDILIVGGGAGGSGRHSGGGGAGALLTGNTTVSTGSYAITIGGGSTGAIGNGVLGSNGTATTLTGLATADGGGYAGVYGDSGQISKNPNNGGSGGGGGYGINTYGSPVNTTTPSWATFKGNRGGTGGSAYVNAGGGGGAGSAGTDTQGVITPGNGGSGYLWYDGYYYAGGGGGQGWDVNAGNGGIGGGGGGNLTTSAGSSQGSYTVGIGGGSARNSGSNGIFAPNNGTTYQGGNAGQNTGSGGGGGAQSGYQSYDSQGGNGGSGIVVVRYPRAYVGG